MREERDGTDWRTRVIAWAGAWVVRALAATWRVRFVADQELEIARRVGHPVIYTIWHGDILPQLWAHRNRNISVMISEHRDGEIIARIAESLGYRTVRGSTSRGATRALAAMVRELKAGFDGALTPDGPRGPYHSYAAGALLVAQRSGRPVLPVGAHASRAWVLKSWDRFTIPKPFARVTIAYGPFLTPPADVAPSELASSVDAYVHALDQAGARAAGRIP